MKNLSIFFNFCDRLKKSLPKARGNRSNTGFCAYASKIARLFFLSIVALISIELLLRMAVYFFVTRRAHANPISEGKAGTILCLGESMTACGWGYDTNDPFFTLRHDPMAVFGKFRPLREYSWPGQLQTKLDEKLGEGTYKVVNKAIVAEPDTLGYYATRIDMLIEEVNPKYLVCMLGMNDLLKRALYTPVEDSFALKSKVFLISHFKLFKLVDILQNEIRVKFFRDARSILHIPVKRIRNFLSEHKLRRQIKIFEREIQQNCDSEKAGELFSFLGEALFLQEKWDILEPLTQTMLEKYPENPHALCFMGADLIRQHRKEKAEYYFQRALSRDPTLEWIKHYSMLICEIDNDHERVVEIMNGLISSLFRYRICGELIRHYNSIVEYALSKNIKVICMQYPFLSTDNLGLIFGEKYKNIIFVSNEMNFKEALSENSYDKLFSNRYAYVFGNCTALGNKLISDQVARTILSDG